VVGSLLRGVAVRVAVGGGAVRVVPVPVPVPIIMVMARVQLLARRQRELEHLTALEADRRSLALDNMPEEIMLMRLAAAEAADDARRVDALHLDRVINSTAGAVKNMLLLQSGEVALVPRHTTHLLARLTLVALDASVGLRTRNYELLVERALLLRQLGFIIFQNIDLLPPARSPGALNGPDICNWPPDSQNGTQTKNSCEGH